MSFEVGGLEEFNGQFMEVYLDGNFIFLLYFDNNTLCVEFLRKTNNNFVSKLDYEVLVKCLNISKDKYLNYPGIGFGNKSYLDPIII